MKTLKYLSLLVTMVLLLTPMISIAGIIKVSATPTSSSEYKGQQITVPVTVDISELPERLGSFTAELSWDVQVLKYINYSSGSTEGFDNPVVNTANSSQGKLVFAAANPRGAEGRVNVLNVAFGVIGSEGSSCSLELKFSAMAAAYTFADLLPYIETVTTGVEVRELAKEFSIFQNYPNPFNPETKIIYQLPKAEHVSLMIYNVLGQKIRTLVNEFKEAGNYDVYWDGKDETGKNMPAGIYIYRIRAGSFIDIKKMLLVK